MAFSHTFVIPSHNQGQFLEGTIVSLINQDDPCSEILVSEDYSSDNSMEIAQAYAAKYPGKVRVTRPPDHKGMFPNWNWGISQTTTEWISIMGSDDQALPNFITTVREGIARAPNTVVVGANWHFVDGNDNLLFTEKMLSLPEVMRPPQTFYLQLFANRVHPAAHAFRRDAWEKVGGFPTELKLYADWGFWLLLTPLGDFVHMRRVIARYRINYRPGLEIARMNQNISDEVVVRLDLIPRIARQFKDVSQWRMNLASRRRFRHMLNRISLDLNGADPSEQVKIFEPWAHELGPGAVRLLDRFARSEPIGLDWFDSNIVLPVREIYKIFQPSSRSNPSLATASSGEAVKLSVVVPITKGDSGWSETLRSAAGQAGDTETIAVVSGDEAFKNEVTREGGPKVQVIAAPANGEEPAGAGVAAAVGNWIVVARPGSRLEPGAAGRIAEASNRTPAAVALVAGASTMAWPENFLASLSGAVEAPRLFAFRKFVWQSVGGYQPEVRAMSDTALLLKLAVQGQLGGGLDLGPAPGAGVDPWMRLRDVEFVHRTLGATLAARRGGLTKRELDDAGRRALRALAKDLAVLDGNDRARAADLLSDWADYLGEPAMLEDLRGGRAAPARRPMVSVKRRLRSFYRSLR